MEDQLAQAVEIASNPTAVQDASLPAQALNFLEHLKSITHESWSAGWIVFSTKTSDGIRDKYNEQARIFGLNLVADFLENHISEASDPAGAVAYLQDSALRFIHHDYVSGAAERTASYVKNKLAQVLTMLLLQTYSLPQPANLLSTLIALTRTHSNSATSPSAPLLNPTTTDLVLRILHDLSVTLGSDSTLRAVRTKDRLHRDALIRDEIRANHAVALAQAVWSIVQDGIAKINAADEADGWGSAKAAELTEMAISVVGDYVSWIDISLMVTPETVSLFFTLLQHRDISLRKASADALLEVVSKGMKPASKLELLQVLQLTTVVGALENETRTVGSAVEGDGRDGVVELRERLARLANGVTLELVKILEESATEESTRITADELLVRHLSLMLAFLADEYDEPTECVLSGTNAVLSYYKKLKRKQSSNENLSSAQLDALARVVDVALSKMKYDEEAEWTGAGTGDVDGGASDEDEAHFIELRKQLQLILNAVASIEESIFSTRVQHLIGKTLTAAQDGLNGSGPQVSWQQAEMAVFAAFFYVEVLINASGLPKVGVSANTFVQMPPDAVRTLKNKLSISIYPTLPLNTLGEAFQSVVQSNIASYPHPAVQLQFFECLNRYSSFFITRPDNLSVALFAFLDQRGLYNGHTGIRHRVWYLFSRFVKEVAGVIPRDYIQRVLISMRDILVVNAELPLCDSDEDPLAKATESAGPFDSQLYLFESCGCLISLLKNVPEEQTTLLKAVCDPLMGQLQQAVHAYSTNGHNLREVLQAHHLMLALANIAQGFPDLAHNALTAADLGWVEEFKSVTEQILIALGALNRFGIIREASRGAFARIVATTGLAVLPFIPNLIQSLLAEITSAELIDFLSFLGLVVTKYKANVQPMLDELLLLLMERIFHFLKQEVSGTDDAVLRTELQRAYISFVSSLVTTGLDGILISERNQGQLQTILESVVFYATNGDATCQRASFHILSRLVVLWAGDAKGGQATASANGIGVANGAAAVPSSVKVPGFDAFLYETLVPLTFEVPAKASFDFNDAQSQMVLGEISTLLKTILSARGMELQRFLVEVYFPGIQCPSATASEFVENLKGVEVKKFKVYLQGFIKASRGG